MKKVLSFVGSKIGIDLASNFENADRTTIVISAAAITSVATVTYIIKKQYDYYKNMKAPSDEIAKFESTAKYFECRNGSIIEYQEYGNPNGFPILGFHGSGK